MLLKVDHVTRYRYDRPVRAVVQSHRLTPSVFDGQKVLDWAVTVTEGVPGGVFRDGAGDAVQGWTVLGPLSQIDVTVSGTVETFDLSINHFNGSLFDFSSIDREKPKTL